MTLSLSGTQTVPVIRKLTLIQMQSPTHPQGRMEAAELLSASPMTSSAWLVAFQGSVSSQSNLLTRNPFTQRELHHLTTPRYSLGQGQHPSLWPPCDPAPLTISPASSHSTPLPLMPSLPPPQGLCICSSLHLERASLHSWLANSDLTVRPHLKSAFPRAGGWLLKSHYIFLDIHVLILTTHVHRKGPMCRA